MDDRSITVTRRIALQAGGAASVGLWIGLHPGLASALTPTATADAAPSYLRRSTYAGLSSSTFTDVASHTPLQLGGVADLSDPALAGSDSAFSLALTASDTTLPEGIRTLSHPEIGTFSVFIAPVGAPAAGATYEMVVDRSIDPDAPAASAPATAPAAAASTPVGAAPAAIATATAAPAAVKAHAEVTPQAHEAAVERIVARRAHGGLTVEVFLRPGTEVRSLRVGLRRDGRRYGGASATVHGLHTIIELPTAHRLVTGHYEAIVTASTDHGAPEISAFPVSLH